jgi:hypothetical protein
MADEGDDDEDTNLQRSKKNLKGRKKSKSMVIESSDDSDHNMEKGKHTASRDSDIEEIKKESPEEEVGELSIMA